MGNLPLVYVKTGCPWCAEALEFLDDNGIEYCTLNVREDPKAMQEMIEVSGQSKSPTMVWSDGDVLADFGAAELESFLRDKGVL